MKGATEDAPVALVAEPVVGSLREFALRRGDYFPRPRAAVSPARAESAGSFVGRDGGAGSSSAVHLGAAVAVQLPPEAFWWRSAAGYVVAFGFRPLSQPQSSTRSRQLGTGVAFGAQPHGPARCDGGRALRDGRAAANCFMAHAEVFGRRTGLTRRPPMMGGQKYQRWENLACRLRIPPGSGHTANSARFRDSQ